ncbi:MAG: peptidase S1 [Firmicutes bacterium HGW-Firmicutes-15]|nr:MAG: peptidase S1 [Firmicutes bacterium HGW-Firmicutes-15]
MNEGRRKSKALKTSLILTLVVLLAGTLFVFKNNFFMANAEQDKYLPSSIASPVIIGPTNIADMVEKVSPAVVNIETSAVVGSANDAFINDPFFRQFFGNNAPKPRQNVQKGIGTGFIISADGYVLTNQHVIDNATTITVKIAGSESNYPAKVVGQDYELDLAVLKIDANREFTPMVLGDSNQIRVGEWVVAIGNPYGLDHTVTVGVVSAKGRPMNIENRPYKNLIQTDAAINPGNSGGPLLNTQGQVIGINTAVNAQAQGIGFAISVNTAKDIINELIQKGKVTRPYIGVLLPVMDANLEAGNLIPSSGVIVSDVVPGGPAEKAGIRKNDVIIGLNDTQVGNYDQLQEFLKTQQVSAVITVHLMRGGIPLALPLTLAEKPSL